MNLDEAKDCIKVMTEFVLKNGTYEMKRKIRNIVSGNKGLKELINHLEKSIDIICKKEFESKLSQ